MLILFYAGFKIYEDGLDSSGVWAVTRLVNNKGKVNIPIPSCIPSGNYLLRAELIALHGASSYPGAQFYMECAQINVTGGGSASPATVSFPGAYAGSDPGITINVSRSISSRVSVSQSGANECGILDLLASCYQLHHSWSSSFHLLKQEFRRQVNE